MYCNYCHTFTDHTREYHRLEIISTLFFFIIVSLALLVGVMWATGKDIPKCQEDQVLVGQGEFHDGRWDVYVCGPALDDFPTPEDLNAVAQ